VSAPGKISARDVQYIAFFHLPYLGIYEMFSAEVESPNLFGFLFGYQSGHGDLEFSPSNVVFFWLANRLCFLVVRFR
jgi:hypothetical protein